MGAAGQVKTVLEDHRLLLDTCFAMSAGFEDFCSTYSGVLESNPILVPATVQGELVKLANKSDTQKSAKKALHVIGRLKEDGKVDLRGEDSDQFTDLVIQRVVEQYCQKYKWCILTNDVGLMKDLHKKKQKESLRYVKDIRVVKLHGKTQEPVFFTPGKKTVSKPASSKGKKRAVPEPFETPSKVAPGINKLIQVRKDVTEGTSLKTASGKSVKLGQSIERGGEGTVYRIAGEANVCKIYHDDKLTVCRKKKLKKMVSRRVECDGICWPNAILEDSDGVFRGFTMPRARGKTLKETICIPAAFTRENPDWTRCESVVLAQNILSKIRYLHDMNVLIGDINELNILMVNEREVYFVDCDSYQVEGYPCAVGTVNFTPPRLQGRDFSTFLRNKDDELFGVATLLFMILMAGKCPYSHQGGTDGASNIQKGHFPYPVGEEHTTDGAPLGPWRLCWSHISRDLKEAFLRSFDKNHRDKCRVELDEWSSLLEEYGKYLKRHGFHGPQRKPGFDLSILPKNYRRLRGEPLSWQKAFAEDYDTDLAAISDGMTVQSNTRKQRSRGARKPGQRTGKGSRRRRKKQTTAGSSKTRGSRSPNRTRSAGDLLGRFLNKYGWSIAKGVGIVVAILLGIAVVVELWPLLFFGLIGWGVLRASRKK